MERELPPPPPPETSEEVENAANSAHAMTMDWPPPPKPNCIYCPRDVGTSNNRHSALGIEGSDASCGVHYSYILPKAEAVPQSTTYLTVLPPRRQANSAKIVDDQYELVSRPVPPYENTSGLEFTTFGFSSLGRSKVRFGVNNYNDCSDSNGSSDSGVDFATLPRSILKKY